MAHKYKYAYRFEVERGFMQRLKVAASELGVSMKQFIMEAVVEKIKKGKGG